jgi:hypothetical protein
MAQNAEVPNPSQPLLPKTWNFAEQAKNKLQCSGMFNGYQPADFSMPQVGMMSRNKPAKVMLSHVQVENHLPAFNA